MDSNVSFSSSEDLDTKPKKINWRFLIAITITASLGGSQISPILTQKANYQYGLIGVILGSLICGKAMQYGRRRSFIIFNFLSIIACFIQFFNVNSKLFNFSKTLFGLSAGALLTLGPRIIEETIPSDLYDFGFGPSTQFLIDMTMLLTIFNSPQFSIPLLCLCLQYFLILRDTIGYHVNNGDKRNAIKSMKQVYINYRYGDYEGKYDEMKYGKKAEEEGESEDPIEEGGNSENMGSVQSNMAPSHQSSYLLGNLFDTMSSYQFPPKPSDVQQVGFLMALKHDDHWQATWFCFVLVVLNQMTGISFLIMHIQALFKQCDEDGNTQLKLTKSQMAIQLVVSTLIGGCVSIYLVIMLSRRSIFLMGHAFMGIFLLCTGSLLQSGQGFDFFNCLCMSVMMYQILSTPLWMYQAEILSDPGLGMTNALRFLIFMGLKTLLKSLYDIRNFKSQSLFRFFGVFQILAFAIIWLFMMETKDLTPYEKRRFKFPVSMCWKRRPNTMILEFEEEKDKRSDGPQKSDEQEIVEQNDRKSPEGDWIDNCYQKPQNFLERSIDKFVIDSFKQSGISPDDILNRNQCFILLADLMHKHDHFEKWEAAQYLEMFELYEQVHWRGGVKRVGLDAKRLRVMVVRCMKL